MDEHEPEAKLSSPIISSEKQYRRKPERLDRALFVGAAVALIVVIAIVVVWQFLASPL